MTKFYGAVGSSILNNPLVLVGIVVAVIAVVVVVTFAWLKGPKHIAKIKAKKEAKEKALAEKEAQKAEDAKFEERMFANRKTEMVDVGDKKEMNTVLGIVQSKQNEPTAKQQLKAQKVEEGNAKKANDVISMMQGGVIANSTGTNYDHLRDKKIAEDQVKNEEKKATQTDNVMSIMQRNGVGGTTQPVEDKNKKKK